MHSSPEAMWACSDALDWYPDGSLVAHDGDISPGLVAPRVLFDLWERTGAVPLHPATLCARTDVLRAYGGWMGLPASEDTGLLMAISTAWVGVYIHDISMHYRKSSTQLTAQQAVVTPRQAALRRKAVVDRVGAQDRFLLPNAAAIPAGARPSAA